MSEIAPNTPPPAGEMLPAILPPLREDLQLHEAAPNTDGSPAWVIQDPVNNAFYRIGWIEFELLSRWHLETPSAVLESAAAETLIAPSEDELVALVAFLNAHQLVALHDSRHTGTLYAMHRRRQLSRVRWLLHHYLFFRIPLWHPDRFLSAISPHAQRLFRPITGWVLLALCGLGGILAARQWDVFAASFVDTLTVGGLVGYLLALAVAKSIHELAHAVTATRYGVRVAHMGVAFLVLWPVLYTDTGESWRLKDRNQRLRIAAAGIAAELILAGLATLVWSLAEPGEIRQALFFLATTAWVISLGLNASPFMRFDGYFILSDILDIPNLHERSFALARTWMRNRLLGWNDPDPEHFSPQRRAFLIAFAFATWIYRLIVFVGIAIAVYLYFFKLLGIFLFLVEIAWFVARPIYNETKLWHERKGEILPSRRIFAAMGLGGAMVIGLTPWNLNVSAEAWAHSRQSHAFYSPLPSRVLELPAELGQQQKEENEPVFVLEHPESEFRANAALVGVGALASQLSGLGELPEGEQKRRVLEQMLAARQAEAVAQIDESSRLQLRMPFNGVLLDADPALRSGVWVSPRQVLAIAVDPGTWQAEAFVRQNDLDRISVGNRTLFYPEDDRLFPVRGRVAAIDTTRVELLPHALLSSHHGGNIAVLTDNSGLTPRDALFRVHIDLDSRLDRLAIRRGSVLIDAKSRSWVLEAIQAAIAVMIREASF